MISVSKILLFFLFCCVWQLSLGQAQNNKLGFDKEITFKVSKADSSEPKIKAIIDSSFSFESPFRFKGKTDPKDWYWVRLDFKQYLGHIKPDSTVYLKFNSFDYGFVFYQEEDTISRKTIGLFDENRISEKVKHSNYFSFLEFTKSKLIEGRYLLFKVKRITFKEDLENWHFIYSYISPNSYVNQADLDRQFPYYFFTGLCFIMWFSTLVFYLMLRKQEFLFYSIYVLITFLYVCGNIFGIFDLVLNSPYLTHWISQSFLFVDNIVYAYFFAIYLNTKNEYPIVHFLVKLIVLLNIIILFIISILFILGNTLGFTFIIHSAFVVLNIIAIFGLIYLLLVGKNMLAYIIAFASLAYCIAPLLRTYLAKPEDGLLLDSLFYVTVGCAIEIVIFAYGLFYKVHLDFNENLSLQKKALIEKTKALRAQINPHFIFNSLSSIQHLVTTNNKVSALKYLSKFSRLTRNILESSMGTNVSLEDEINMLVDYLELESLRFDNTFTYKITVDEQLNPENVTIPFMIMQPFVENGIIHGLLPKKEGDKKLSINFLKAADFVICEVEDNGVGRQMSKKGEPGYNKRKVSRGIEVTKERLHALVDMDDVLQILDKFDDKGHPTGTKIILKIPL